MSRFITMATSSLNLARPSLTFLSSLHIIITHLRALFHRPAVVLVTCTTTQPTQMNHIIFLKLLFCVPSQARATRHLPLSAIDLVQIDSALG